MALKSGISDLICLLVRSLNVFFYLSITDFSILLLILQCFYQLYAYMRVYNSFFSSCLVLFAYMYHTYIYMYISCNWTFYITNMHIQVFGIRGNYYFYFYVLTETRLTVTASWFKELKVYVDGFPIDQPSQTVDRVYVPQPYNAAPYLLAGKHTSVRMFTIRHWDEVLTDQEILEGLLKLFTPQSTNIGKYLCVMLYVVL